MKLKCSSFYLPMSDQIEKKKKTMNARDLNEHLDLNSRLQRVPRKIQHDRGRHIVFPVDPESEASLYVIQNFGGSNIFLFAHFILVISPVISELILSVTPGPAVT